MTKVISAHHTPLVAKIGTQFPRQMIVKPHITPARLQNTVFLIPANPFSPQAKYVVHPANPAHPSNPTKPDKQDHKPHHIAVDIPKAYKELI